MTRRSYTRDSRGNNGGASITVAVAATALAGAVVALPNHQPAAQERPAEPQQPDSWIDEIEIRRAADQVPTGDRGI